MKNFLKELTPPLVINLYRKIFGTKKEADGNINNNVNAWTGNYSSWQEAKDHTRGYDDKEILEKCKNALLKIKNGEAKYERDSVLFDEIGYSWPLMAALQRCAIENNNCLSVLDFGGSFGTTYFQSKNFLASQVNVSWHIVEQKNFVEEGKKYFENDTLLFHDTIEDVLKTHRINCLLLSSVLPYLPDPYVWIEKFIGLRIESILIDRTSFIDDGDRLTIQNVPDSIYSASYPCWFFNKNNFLSRFNNNYELIVEFEDSFTPDQIIDGKRCTWKGFFFKIR